MELKVGQEIFLKSTPYSKPEIVKATISKIGRKYFEVTPRYLGRYFLDTMIHDDGNYSAKYKAYTSLEEIEKEEKRRELGNKISSFFKYGATGKLTLDQLEQIQSIIDAK